MLRTKKSPAGSDRVVEEMGGSLGVDGAVVQDGEAVFSLNHEGPGRLGEGSGDEIGGKAVAKDDATTEEGSKGRDSIFPKEAASGQRWRFFAPESLGGFFSEFVVELVKSFFLIHDGESLGSPGEVDS